MIASLQSERESKTPSAPENRPVVFLVDDDTSVRESLEPLIVHAGWYCKPFTSATAFLESPPIAAPSCLVLDVYLPDLNGLDLQERIASQRFHMPIIFITGYGDVPMTVRAMKAGAAEFLTKPINDDALLAGIGNALDRSARTRAREAELLILENRYASLSCREREVMALVVKGHLNKRVAATLGISEITVKAHRGNVMRKMRVASLAELVKVASQLHDPDT